MAVLELVKAPDPRLKLVSQPVAEVDAALRRFMDDMVDTMYAANGIGLAAIQIGVPTRVAVIDLDPGGPNSKVLYIVNPRIVDASGELSTYHEGCLSVPEQYAEVMRPDKIRARWQDATGKAYEEEIDGLLAVCLQHEMDHLEGVLFIDHLSRLKRDMVLKKLAKWRKEQALKAA
jgi:peptide deformylase